MKKNQLLTNLIVFGNVSVDMHSVSDAATFWKLDVLLMSMQSY